MSWLSRMFGGGGGSKPVAPETIEYNGFRITPDPMPADGQFRISALIQAEVNGETKTHHLIRADVMRSREEAETASVNKARQAIDQMGNRLFD